MQKVRSNHRSEHSTQQTEGMYLYTKGGQYSLDGQEYVGEYHLIGDNAFTGPIHTSNSKRLGSLYLSMDVLAYDTIHNFQHPVKSYKDPIPYRPNPTNQDYSTGFFMRYFVEKVNNLDGYTIEIDRPQYETVGVRGGIDGGLYSRSAVKWRLIGPPDAVIADNGKELAKASRSTPSILRCNPQLTQFIRQLP